MKNIIYLDEAKMFSLSAQLFEGLTEYVFKEKSSENTLEEEQKGKVFAGKLMAEAMRKSERSIEKRFMHDYAYSLFEKELKDRKILTIIDSSVNEVELLTCKNISFVKIVGRVQFIDSEKVTRLIGSYNNLGAALAYISSHDAVLKIKQQFDEERSSANGNKGRLAAISKTERNTIDEIKKIAVGELYQDPDLLKNLDFLLDYAYAGTLEALQRIGGYTYSSNLNRENMRESVDSMIRKYSRTTERELVVLGVVAQSAGDIDEKENFPESASSMREAVVELVNHLSKVERSMFGKSVKQVVVDPIAVYVNL